jgi:hypothetical protein
MMVTKAIRSSPTPTSAPGHVVVWLPKK